MPCFLSCSCKQFGVGNHARPSSPLNVLATERPFAHANRLSEGPDFIKQSADG
jgi:hypothetical protein